MTDDRLKQTLLSRVYEAFDEEVGDRFKLACSRRCSLCCTHDVTLTTIEARPVMDRLRQMGREDILAGLNDMVSTRFQPTYTINDFAQACFNRQDLPEEGPGPDPRPCPLLENDLCLVYDVRPLSCRGMASTIVCRPDQEAEAPSELVSLVTVCLQIIEHLDTGGYYGNLTDVLRGLAEAPAEGLSGAGLLETRTLPAFLIHPDDADVVRPFLGRLFAGDLDGAPFHERMAEVRRILR